MGILTGLKLISGKELDWADGDEDCPRTCKFDAICVALPQEIAPALAPKKYKKFRRLIVIGYEFVLEIV
jgi:hypothetical protein